MTKPRASVPAKWQPLLEDIDAQIGEPVELHCLGGFGLDAMGALDRPTEDIDFLPVLPSRLLRKLEELAGRGTTLARRHGRYIEAVTVAEYSEDYRTRLIPIASNLQKIELLALEPHDLALAKLTRNGPKDRYDVAHLAKRGLIEPTTLYERYQQSVRPYLRLTDRHDLTIELWVQDIREMKVQELTVERKDIEKQSTIGRQRTELDPKKRKKHKQRGPGHSNGM
ncbi:MAG: hypothetical protein A2289_09605 [Deltaproteobacteria bacterium RIFOXYA12_FULL_58_15]|nr:MAG: hypothetical protein A2289_09605 [Deltaproteobacteria bacterium RIFOXYA12_FULL_58_15]OGR12886.1 MAG: hypothetical protein A2341_23730 [Deltaproteobacteria bacterium RIFOXYB12_FULL_58_9]